jgi:signal transduction histidine kinase
VHEQQRTSSEIVAHQASAMLTIHELNIVMRELRYQLIGFLRTHDPQHLKHIADLHDSADTLLESTQKLARPGRESERSQVVEAGYRSFFNQYQAVVSEILPASAASEASFGEGAAGTVALTPEHTALLTDLSYEVLSNRVLKPLEESLADNKRFVEETNAASQATAQHLKIGFLLLGICGAVAGLLLGTAIAGTIGRSIVQLNVTVRGVAGRLSDVTGPVTFSHTGGLADIDFGLRELERDIAEVVERLQQRETELLRSEQLANLGQLAAGVAHELRNPLMPMKILVQAALERNDGVGLKGRSLQVINEEIGRLEDTICSFLDYARPPVPEKSALDIREVVSGTLDLVTGRARQQGVEIEATLPSEELVTQIDRSQIRQLLLNLLLNALDALPEGGRIQCSVVPCDPDRDSQPSNGDRSAFVVAGSETFTEHDAMRLLSASPRPRSCKKKWLALQVADDGPGIPADALGGVFEPFVTTKETGTGLGLSVCRRIAAAHDGELTVRNRSSGGAEFTLLLPCSG